VFIQIIQARCNRQDDCRAMLDRWLDELAPGADGWLGGTYGFTDDGQLVAVVRFESREAAMANSERPEQGRWWAEVEKTLDGPAEFHESDDVTVMMDGGSDSAGFVQVMRGKVDDPSKLKAMMTDTSMLHEMRPEIIGATLVLEDDGTFIETVAFTSEDDARRSESTTAMPEEMRRDWDSMMHDVTYLDLHQPWFSSARR